MNPGRQFACLVENQKTLLGDDTTLLLSAGDNIGGSLFVSFVAQDNPTLAYLNALELDAPAVGNHEFDRGFDDLTGRVDTAADFPYLGANVYERGTETPALDEYVIKTVNGVEVAIIGAVTQETASLVSPDGITGIEFGDPVEAANRVATKLSDGNAENGEADVIVAEIHDGAASVTGGAPAANAIYDRMVNELSAEVDVIFNGHTHQIYAFDAPITSGTRNISQAGQYGGGLTRRPRRADLASPTPVAAEQLAGSCKPAPAHRHRRRPARPVPRCSRCPAAGLLGQLPARHARRRRGAPATR